MTRKEAVKRLHEAKYTIQPYQYINEALDMAIKALEQEPTINDIITEIETDFSFFCFDEWGNETLGWKELKAIIKKYESESEV